MTEFRNWEDFARAMKKKAAVMPEAFREGTTKATTRLHVASQRLIRELIYDKAEDTTKTSFKKSGRGTGGERFVTGAGGGRKRSKVGRKKWTRTGLLRRSEQKVILSPTQGAVFNNANYALPRHDLGLPPGNQEAIKGSLRKSDRKAPWRVRAIVLTEEGRRQDYRDAIWRRLTRR